MHTTKGFEPKTSLLHVKLEAAKPSVPRKKSANLEKILNESAKNGANGAEASSSNEKADPQKTPQKKKVGAKTKGGLENALENMKTLSIGKGGGGKKRAAEKRFQKYLSNGSAEKAGTAFRRFRSLSVPRKIKPRKKTEPQLLVKLTTVMIADLYRQCNPEFKYKSSVRPRRALSKPSKAVSNNGHDNSEANLIMYANDILHSESGPFRSFRVEEMLGKGTFGQVVKAEDLDSKKKVAVKIIKNKQAYYNQAIIEIQILNNLNKRHDPNDENNIVRLLDTFVYKNHLCLVFELLSVNLYELIKQNRFRGLSCNLIRTILKQILRAVNVMSSAGIIHCDLKPENILLSSLTSAKIKLIDFGSACDKNNTIYSYIQSRFYRSPEVLLGLPYDMKIDMWSIGCVAAELFLGLPLFPGVSAFNQIYRIVEMLGVPTKLLRRSKKTKMYFNKDPKTEYRIKTIKQFAEENKSAPVYPKRYFKATSLETLVREYPYRTTLSPEDKEKEQQNREHFIDFLSSLLKLNPEDRASPVECLCHPFIVGEEMAGKAKNITRISPKRRTQGFDIPLEKPKHLKSSAPVPIRSATGSFGSSHRSSHTMRTGYIPHSTEEYKSYDSPYESIRGPSSQSVMITPCDMSFTKEMADHTPINHTPVQRAMAHPHSLTMASSPMVGSPMRPSYMSDMNHNGSVWMGQRGSPVHGSPHRGSPLRGSPLRGSPLRGSPMRNSPAIGSPARARGLWIPGPRLRGSSDAPSWGFMDQYGSPENSGPMSHPHSWGHNTHQHQYLSPSVGVHGFKPKPSPNPNCFPYLRPYGEDPSVGGYRERKGSLDRNSFHPRPGGIPHAYSYSSQPGLHQQHQPRYGHSPFQNFQPPLRNVIPRGGGGHAKQRSSPGQKPRKGKPRGKK